AVRGTLGQDLAEIDAIARSVIDFASLQYTEEDEEMIDIWSLVASLADGYPAVAFDHAGSEPRGLVCRARSTALRRCIANLLDNAVAYGGTAEVSLAAEGTLVVLTIADDG